MIRDDSPRWVKLLPSALYGCLFIVVIVATVGFGYVWLAQARLGLSGTVARLFGLAVAGAIGIPALLLLSRTRLRKAALTWGRRVDLEDTRGGVQRLIAKYRISKRTRDIEKARELLASLRRRNRDPQLGAEIEALIDAAEKADLTNIR